MKFLAIVAAALAIAAPATADLGVCERKAPEVRYAIGKFCMALGTANVVPNAKAGNGMGWKYKGKSAVIHIKADCKPGQWIPRGYCTSQLYRVSLSSPSPRVLRLHELT